jgi:hypothetical protein
MRKILFNLYLDQEDFDFLVQKANSTGRSRSALVRSLVKLYRKEDRKRKEARNNDENKDSAN